MTDESYSGNRSSYGSTPSDFIGELNDAIRQNPVPAALVGVGILWMFMGGRTVSLGGASQSVVSGIGRGARNTSAATFAGVRRTADGVVAGVAENVGEAAALLSGAAMSGASGVGRAIGRAAETVGDSVSNAAERMWSQTSDETAGTHSDRPAEDSIGSLRRAQDTLAGLFARQPLLLGAVGVAIGAGIAATLPASALESSLMGETADAVKDRAGEVWNEAKRRGGDLASRSLKEAEAQDITPAAAGVAARKIVSKVDGVVEKASNDIVDRTRR